MMDRLMIEELVNQLQGYLNLLRRLGNNYCHITSRIIDSKCNHEETLVHFCKSVGLQKTVKGKSYISTHSALEKCIAEVFMGNLDIKSLQLAKIIEWDIHEYIDMIIERDIETSSMVLFRQGDDTGKVTNSLIIKKNNESILISVAQT